jgi:hypothetical protein
MKAGRLKDPEGPAVVLDHRVGWLRPAAAVYFRRLPRSGDSALARKEPLDQAFCASTTGVCAWKRAQQVTTKRSGRAGAAVWSSCSYC